MPASSLTVGWAADSSQDDLAVTVLLELTRRAVRRAEVSSREHHFGFLAALLWLITYTLMLSANTEA